MAIIHKQEVIAEDIQATITENGQNAITGTLLQRGMLQLNGCGNLFNGEIMYGGGREKLGMAELLNFLPPDGPGRLLGPWKAFMDELTATDYNNVYTAIYDGSSGQTVVGYMLFSVASGTVKCSFLCNTYADGDLYSFEVSGRDWTISNVKKLTLA